MGQKSVKSSVFSLLSRHYLEYPEYYEDEGILEEEEKWLEEFLNQLPEKKREYFEKLIKES